MRELIDELGNLKLAIFDLDGVIYRGKSLIANSDKIIQELKDLSVKVVYNSNNSTATRDMYVERLKNMNIYSKNSDFYTSASITSEEITKIKQNANIYVVGEVGLREELKTKGHVIITEESKYKEVDFVIVGMDRDFTYKTLALAQKCILEGKAQFYATNADATFPIDKGLLPVAGVMVKAVETCTYEKPIQIFGKPEPFGIESILKDHRIQPEYACIFGDRLDTDIVAGNRVGITTIAVLTGVTSIEKIDILKKDLESSNSIDNKLIPDIVINSLDEIFK
jgi:phosphoglycolate/pyridoxal phosphate phosphatase family enzyme